MRQVSGDVQRSGEVADLSDGEVKFGATRVFFCEHFNVHYNYNNKTSKQHVSA
jgi:hypothetical protein